MTRPHVVVALVGRRAAPFELGVVHEVFGLQRIELAALIDPPYEMRVVGAFGSPIPTNTSDWSITTRWDLDALTEADTIVIATWNGYDDPTPEPILEAMRAAHQRGARIMSVCTGAFLLAEAGLLQGRKATTHWMHAPALIHRYPSIDVDPDVLFVEAGDGIYTSAGTASGIDLCLHIVRQDHGAEAANALARRMVVPPQRDGGQAQFVNAPMPVAECGDRMAATLAWAVENLGQPLKVEDLARRALMSPRTFARRFNDATGTTPLHWLTRQRVIHAQRLLESTELPVEVVGQQCGFGTGTAFRVQFRRVLGTSPLAYRRTFQCADAS